MALVYLLIVMHVPSGNWTHPPVTSYQSMQDCLDTKKELRPEFGAICVEVKTEHWQ